MVSFLPEKVHPTWRFEGRKFCSAPLPPVSLGVGRQSEEVFMQIKQIESDGISLYSESFGSPADPPVLLIMGAMSSALWWPEDFCRQLANLGRYVIRYDHRDTGRSTCYPPGTSSYSVEDLADDAVRVLRSYGIESAHVVGMSLGGFLAQLVALKYPDSVRSLTLIASERLADPDPGMPSMNSAILDYHQRAGELDWTDRQAVVAYQVGAWRLLSGSAHEFDKAAIRELARADFDRASSLLSMFNHAALAEGEEWFGRLDEIVAPTLIIHGTDDPVLSYAHGLALKAAIRNSTLLTLKGTGHELHRKDWPVMIRAIEPHTASRT
jgi:pimeloyl-ACP methyl ester carboxylesterase